MKARRGTLVVVAALLISTATMIGAGPAVAKKAPKVKPAITCQLTGVATVSPGLSSTLAVQTLSVTTSLSSCTGSSVPGITGSSGSSTTTSTGKKPTNCASAATKPSVSKTLGTIHWNNGSTSTDKYKTTLRLGHPATLKGKILSGTFDKGKATASLTYAYGPGQNCFGTPITSATLTGTFTIS